MNKSRGQLTPGAMAKDDNARINPHCARCGNEHTDFEKHFRFCDKCVADINRISASMHKFPPLKRTS